MRGLQEILNFGDLKGGVVKVNATQHAGMYIGHSPEGISILKGVRTTVVGTEDNTEFDQELILHINSAISKLNQNGVGNFIFVTDEEQTWGHLKDQYQVEGNKYFQMVPLYITLSTQLLFDPPPPSNVEYHSNSARELLWRLHIAYEG